jgi:two-component system OmpR family sensor kinase
MSPARRSAVRRRPPLRTTLVALLVGTLAVLCLLVGVVTHVSVDSQLSAQLDSQLSRAADRHGPGGGNGPGGSEYELGARLTGAGLQGAGWRNQQGRIQQLSTEDQAILADAAGDADRGAYLTVDLSIGEYRIHVTSADDPGGSAGSQEKVITGLPLDPVDSTLRRLDLTLVAAGLIAMALTAVIGSLIVRRTLRPLEEVQAVAVEVAELPLEKAAVPAEARVRADVALSGTEAGDVGRALNLLLDNVQDALEVRRRSEDTMRRFVADASHELRTPLTAIRGYTQLLRLTEELTERGEQSVDRMEAQSERMTSLVEDLLLLARLDEDALNESRRGGEEIIELGEIVTDAVVDAKVTAPGHRWLLEVGEEEILVKGDPRQITRAIVNLLSNARKHTPEGTTVQVRLRVDRGQAVFQVIDDGPGIAPELQSHVFERFTRADAARSGGEATTGLGLPIVQAIVQAQHGVIAVDSHPGRTEFIVRLPLAG